MKTPGSTASLVDIDPFPPVVGMVEVNWANQTQDDDRCRAPKRGREERDDSAHRPRHQYTYNENLAHEVLDDLIDDGLVTVANSLPYIEYKEGRIHCKFHNS